MIKHRVILVLLTPGFILGVLYQVFITGFRTGRDVSSKIIRHGCKLPIKDEMEWNRRN